MNFELSNMKTNNILVVLTACVFHTWILFAFILIHQESHVIISHLL